MSSGIHNSSIAESINKFNVFLQAKADKTNPVYYLPEDIVETILKEYIKDIEILLKGSSSIVDLKTKKKYIWTDANGFMHRRGDLPSQLTIVNKGKFITEMSWFIHGANIRAGDKPCEIRYSDTGKLMYKRWDDGTAKTRKSGLPIRIIRETYGRGLTNAYFKNGEVISFQPQEKLPEEYGWE